MPKKEKRAPEETTAGEAPSSTSDHIKEPESADKEPGLHRVLIVDDSPSIRTLVMETLKEMPGVGTIESAEDGIEGLAVLSRQPFDLVITDVTMPRLDGFKLVTAIRQNPMLKNMMIIVLSSRDESVDKIRGLTVGANDYVTKPFEKGELQARVTVMFKMKALQEELQRKNAAMEAANAKLATLANQDGLTQIPNRRYFFERFEVELQRALRLKSPLGLLLIDIDHFKSFNDTYGHQAGDEVLRGVAGVLLKGIRTYDMVGRYGGEEMIVFLPETESKMVRQVAERLRKSVEKTKFRLTGDKDAESVGVTVSIGVACIPEFGATATKDLVEAADVALYRAKTEGRNRCVSAEASPPPPPE